LTATPTTGTYYGVLRGSFCVRYDTGGIILLGVDLVEGVAGDSSSV